MSESLTSLTERELREENVALRTELREQWESNHAEHCRWEWPHEGICTYPLPAILADRSS